MAHNGDKWQAVVNTVMNIWVPYTAENFLTRCSTVSFSRKAVLHGVCWFVYLVGWLFVCLLVGLFGWSVVCCVQLFGEERYGKGQVMKDM